MASPHPSVTSSHNSPQTPQTRAASPHILPDLLKNLYIWRLASIKIAECLTTKTASRDPIAAKRCEEKKILPKVCSNHCLLTLLLIERKLRTAQWPGPRVNLYHPKLSCHGINQFQIRPQCESGIRGPCQKLVETRRENKKKYPRVTCHCARAIDA